MKERLDVFLVRTALCQSRERAKELIEQGKILVNGMPAKKAGQAVLENDKIEITGEQNPFVSRGGLKLLKAIECFNLDLSGKTAMDIGASTGGFTHCMLLHGVQKVYAVDVGCGQLHQTLREDTRVVNLEKTNIRALTEDMAEKADFISIDTSFISLTLVLPEAKRFLKTGGEIVALIKPQFEAGKSALNKKGVVKDKKIHKSVIKSVLEFSVSIGLYPKNLTVSPIKGPEGNTEFLVLLSEQKSDFPDIERVVN